MILCPASVQNSVPPAEATNWRRPMGGTGIDVWRGRSVYFLTVTVITMSGWMVHSK